MRLIFRWIYTGLVYLVLPIALIKLLWRSKQNKAYRQQWNERFGDIHFASEAANAHILWIHAVSVGETIAIRPLIDALLTQHPTYRICLTNGTLNGRIRAEALFGDRILHSYAPYDTPDSIERFLKRLNPVLALVMETEVWPNWMAALRAKQIPVILVNGRLSERSCRGYARFSGIFKSAWQSFTLIAAQGEPDALRYHALGVPTEKIHVVGNLKYNLILPEHLTTQVANWKKQLPTAQIWIAASTHAGEEEILLSVYAVLKKKHPQLLWILVPRHPERVPQIEKICRQEGWRLHYRSHYGALPTHPIQTDILLVDSMGELLLFYALAQVAFVGGSFIPKGGHNIIEPAAVGVAITCGPWMFNFATILEQFKKGNAVVQCENVEALIQHTLMLFENDALRLHYIEAAKKCFNAEQQSLLNHLKLIERFLN